MSETPDGMTNEWKPKVLAHGSGRYVEWTPGLFVEEQRTLSGVWVRSSSDDYTLSQLNDAYGPLGDWQDISCPPSDTP